MRWNEVSETTGEEITIVQHSTTGAFQYATGDEILDLGPTLPGAVSALYKRGIHPTHYLTKDNRFLEIPQAVIPRVEETQLAEAKAKLKTGDRVTYVNKYGETANARIEGPTGRPGEVYIRTAPDRSEPAKLKDLTKREAPGIPDSVAARLEVKKSYDKAWDMAVAIGKAISTLENGYPDDFDAVEWQDLAQDLYMELDGKPVSMAWLLVQVIDGYGISDEWADSIKAKYKGIREDNDVAVVPSKPKVTISGPHKDGLTLEQAVKYLQQYPDGALHHDVFERENFVYLTRQGDWRFFDHMANKVEPWDWRTDIEALRKYADSYDMDAGWWYEPIDWKSELTGETDWFDKLLDGGH